MVSLQAAREILESKHQSAKQRMRFEQAFRMFATRSVGCMRCIAAVVSPDLAQGLAIPLPDSPN